MALFGKVDPAGKIPQAPKQHTAVDGLAVATATAVAVLGGMQLFAPLFASPLTGLEAGIASEIIAVQWLAMAVLLMLGGITRLRAVSIFAAEFLLFGALAACVVMLLTAASSVAVLVHGGIAAMAFACSGMARLFDKAELKRELRFVREQAKPGPGSDPSTDPTLDRAASGAGKWANKP